MSGPFYADDSPEAPPEATITVDPAYIPGEPYEWGPKGESDAWGDALSPDQYPLDELARDAADQGLEEVWVRKSS